MIEKFTINGYNIIRKIFAFLVGTMNISLGFTAALATFVIMYILMLSLQKYRTYIALSAAVLFIVMGHLGLFEMDFLSVLKAIDYNVILMISGNN